MIIFCVYVHILRADINIWPSVGIKLSMLYSCIAEQGLNVQPLFMYTMCFTISEH